MKKNVIALLLSVVLAAGCVGAAPVYAAETNAEEAVAEPEAVEKPEIVEEPEVVKEPEKAAVPEEVEVPEGGAQVPEAEDASEAEESGREQTIEAADMIYEENEVAEANDSPNTVVLSDVIATDEADEIEEGIEAEIEDEIKEEIEEKAEDTEENEAYLAEDVFDSGYWGDNIFYTVTAAGDDLTLSLSGNGDMKEVDQDSTDLPWYGYCDKIKTVVIEDGISSICGRAFELCNNLVSITIPDSVTSIGKYSFQYNKVVGRINISSLESWLDIHDKDSGLAGNLYFNDQLLSNLVIPDGTEEIREYAFRGCSGLTNVTIPDSVMSIGTFAFYGCEGLNNITIPDGVTSIESWTFAYCYGLESITIPDSVTSIGYSSFSRCRSLGSVRIPESVTNIDSYAFNLCTELQSVNIPNGINTIKECTFYGCGFESFTIPTNVTRVDYGAFAGCSKLKSITLPDSMTSFEVTFGECISLESINIPKGATRIRNSAFFNCYALKNVTIPDSVTTIGSGAFYECVSLESVIIPDSVTEISDEAFASCINLRRIAIPDSVTSIGDYAFSGCAELQSILIPKSVTSIGNYCIFNAYDENKATVRYCGSKDEWDNLTKGKRIYYKSILYNCFSVDADFTLSGTSFSYNGKEIKPSVKVVYRGKNLKAGTDYKLSYKNNKIPGTATVDVIGIGEYSGTETLSFEILPIVLGATKKVTCTNVASGIKVSWEEVMGATSYYVYRDDKYLFRTSALNITDKEVKYNSGTKYVYKVVATAKGVGDSPKARTATMYRLMPVGIKSLTNPSVGKMTVSYDKAGGSSGYVVRFGLKSDMSDAKVITVSGQNTLSRTFGGMRKGKTYYVQVRTYKIENGVRYYSGYCTTKKIVIRK